MSSRESAVGTVSIVSLIAGYINPVAGAVVFIVGTVLVHLLVPPEDNRVKERKPDLSREHLGNFRSSTVPMAIPYGRCRLGVNQTFLETTNPLLHIIAEIGEGPIHGIVREDGSTYTTVGTSLPRSNPPRVYFNDKLWTEEYSDEFINMEFFNGSPTQSICSTLQSHVPRWDQVLPYTAYLYVEMKFNEKGRNSIPNITIVVDGQVIYNPITMVTEYSNNAALVTYDYVTRSSQRGGIGISQSRIGLDDLTDTVTYCDVKNWQFNAPITQQQTVADNLRLILNTFRGDFIYSAENIFKLRFRDTNYESVVINLTDEIGSSNIIDRGLKISQPTSMNRPNTIRIVYISEERNFKTDKYTEDDLQAIINEGDVREKEITLFGMTDLEKVQGMAKYFLERLRRNKTAQIVVGPEGVQLEPMDLIQVTHSVPGWVDKLMRVLSVAFDYETNNVKLQAVEEFNEFYDDLFNVTTHTINDSVLPDPTAPVPGVINVSAEEETYFYRNRSFTRWNIFFDPPLATTYPYYSHSEIFLSIGVENPIEEDYSYQTTSRRDYVLDPVDEGELYYIKIRSVADFGGLIVKEDFENAATLSKRILGKTVFPSDIGAVSVIANGSTVTIIMEETTDPDIEGYEIRRGDSWNGGLFHALSNGHIYTIYGVRPGSHTFWMALKDNAGRYSINPISAIVVVNIPPGYTEIDRVTYDFITPPAGTFDNTQHFIYDNDDSLKRINIEKWIGTADIIIDKSVGVISNTNGSFSNCVIRDGSLLKSWCTGLVGTSKWIFYTDGTDDPDSNYQDIVMTTSLIDIGDPSVIKDDTTYKMWFTGLSGSGQEIYYSTSTDGINFSSPSKVISLNQLGGGSYDEDGVFDISVVKVSPSNYIALYAALDAVGVIRILRTTSTDGINWTTPTLSIDVNAGGTGTIDVTAPSLLRRSDNLLEVWYEGLTTGSPARKIYYANSANDGVTFSSHRIAFEPFSFGFPDWTTLLTPQFPINLAYAAYITIGDTNYMYGGRDSVGSKNTIYTSPSNDLTNWTLSTNTLPVLLHGSLVLRVGDDILLIGGYTGGTRSAFIYKATVSDPTNFSPTNVGSVDQPVAYAAGWVDENYIYIFGGDTGGTYDNVIFRGSTAGPTYNLIDTGSTLPLGLYGCAFVESDDNLYLMMGRRTDISTITRRIHRAAKSNPLNWVNPGIQVDGLGLQHSSVVYYLGYVYMVGGRANAPTNTSNLVKRALIDDIENVEDGTPPLETLSEDREGGSVFVGDDNKLYYIAGYDNGTYHDDIIDGINDFSGNDNRYPSILFENDVYTIYYSMRKSTSDSELIVRKAIKLSPRLDGSWESPVYDQGSIQTSLISGVYDTAFIDPATVWETAAPVPSTWEDIDAVTRTWNEAFEPGAAGQITTILRYKEDIGDPWREVTGFELFTAEVKSRYLQLVVNIVDPSNDSSTIVKPIILVIYSGPTEFN